jgi:hydrogenase maturation protease
LGPRKTAVFMGNSIFGDDRIGLLVGEALRPRLESKSFDVHVMERTGFALLDCLEGYDSAVVVDSISSQTSPVGKVKSFTVEDFSCVKPVTPHYSGVPEALRLMKDLGMEVPDVSIIGINVRDPYTLSSDIDPDLDSRRDLICSEVYEGITGDHGRE